MLVKIDIENKKDLIIFMVNINSVQTRCVLDTGSSRNIMNSAYRSKQNLRVLKAKPITFLYADDERKVIDIKTKTLVRFQDVEENVSFYISDALPEKYDVILGLAFCRQFKLKISFTEDSATIIPSPNHDTFFSVAQDHIIPPHELQNVTLINDDIESGNILVELTPTILYRTPIFCPQVIAAIDQFQTSIIISNESNEPCILYCGQNLFQPTKTSDEHFKTSKNGGIPCMLTSEEEFNINEKLTEKEQEDLKIIISEYSDIFLNNLDELEPCPLIEHCIDFYDESEISFCRNLRLSLKEDECIRDKTRQLLSAQIVQPSISPFNSPSMAIKKPNGTMRMVIDMRGVNKLTKPDSYILPRIDSTIDQLNGQCYFTSLDCADGFYSIPLREKDRRKTAFTTMDGAFEFTRMAMGLKGAPGTFCRLIGALFNDVRGSAMVHYMDDLLVIGKTFQEHLQNLELVFSRIRESKLKLRKTKCNFGYQEIKFLGFKISDGTVSPNMEKLRAITAMTPPDTIDKLQSYLGKVAYYRSFIRDHATHAKPLYQMVKTRTIDWTAEALESFEFFKQKLITAPILTIFNPSLEVTLHCDASGYGVGTCVIQYVDGKERNVAYFSRQFNEREMKYSISEKECLSVMFGVKKARCYVYGTHFTIVTDHSALIWLLTMKNLSSRLLRWALFLSDYDFTIVHRKGKNHSNCDSLSRNCLPETISLEKDGDLDDGYELFSIGVVEVTMDEQRIIQLQEHDQLCKQIDNLSSEIKKKQGFVHDNGVLKKRVIVNDSLKLNIVMPMVLFDTVFDQCHTHSTSGHQSVFKTIQRINQVFFHPRMLKLVKNRILSCHSCQVNKTRTTLLNSIPNVMPTSHRLFDIVCCDLQGPLPESHNGNRYIAAAICTCSRYLVAGAIKSKRMEDVAEFLLNHVYFVHSFPRILISDMGKEFINKLLDRIHSSLGIKHQRTTPFNPRANSIIERHNKSIGESLRHYCSQHENDWERHLASIIYGLNTSVSESTGYTPYYLVYFQEHNSLTGYVFNKPTDRVLVSQLSLVEQIRKNAEKNVKSTQVKSQARDAVKYTAIHFKSGDLVLLDWPYLPRHHSKKLFPKYRGPYEVVSTVNGNEATYRLRDLSSTDQEKYVIANLRHMKPYRKPPEENIEQPFVNVIVTTEIPARTLTDHQGSEDDTLIESPHSDGISETASNENESSNESFESAQSNIVHEGDQQSVINENVSDNEGDENDSHSDADDDVSVVEFVPQDFVINLESDESRQLRNRRTLKQPDRLTYN